MTRIWKQLMSQVAAAKRSASRVETGRKRRAGTLSSNVLYRDASVIYNGGRL
jgi:hypothetical protein